MIRMSSTGDLIAAMRGARDVRLVAYTLPPGRVLDGLIQASRAGARVRVRLEGDVYKHGGGIGAINRAAIAELRAAGADAALAHTGQDAPGSMLHLKAALVDGALFLDDRNWLDHGGDTIVRDDSERDAAMVDDALAGRCDRASPFFAVAKRQSLALEARLLDAGRRGDDAIVESESFGAGNRVFNALDDLARRGGHVRLLVNSRDLAGNASERGALARLSADGVAVRMSDVAEKFAVLDGSRGWLGSTNATIAFDRPDQLDWGARTGAPDVIAHLGQAFEERWSGAREFGTFTPVSC
ncbi:MAG TPA: phospholipase D-like domain-containing protein [Candidatus Baltobacteraceae bacterium]|nr:phospholipase D-like domain-containing protein [Candidatus Baltobacteraceae bacterium]